MNTRIEPAGAGGTTGASHQLRRHQLGRGGRWRRSRHLRRVQRPRQAGCGTNPEMLRFPYRNRCKSPFFECSFHEITIEFFLELVQKAVCKKGTDTQTRKQTDRIRPILSISGDRFWTAKTQIPVANASKTCPKTTSGFLLTSQLKSTSGLPRSLHSPQMAPAAQKCIRSQRRINIL